MRFTRFLAAGGLAALINFGSRFVFSLWFPFEVAVVLAFICGLVSGFLLIRFVVFSGTEVSLASSAWRYVAINALALAQTWLISVLLAEYVLPGLGMEQGREALAHAVGIAVPVVTSYIGHKRLTFKMP